MKKKEKKCLFEIHEKKNTHRNKAFIALIKFWIGTIFTTFTTLKFIHEPSNLQYH